MKSLFKISLISLLVIISLCLVSCAALSEFINGNHKVTVETTDKNGTETVSTTKTVSN